MSKSNLDVLDPRCRKDIKTQLTGSKDPYALYANEFLINFGDFSISYPNIVNYLAFRASQYFAMIWMYIKTLKPTIRSSKAE